MDSIKQLGFVGEDQEVLMQHSGERSCRQLIP